MTTLTAVTNNKRHHKTPHTCQVLKCTAYERLQKQIGRHITLRTVDF